MADSAQAEMPKYRCHKEVWALKIARVDTDPDGTVITPEDARYAPFRVTASYVIKHAPQAGGYFVQYRDGYLSWSPAEAFESGYTRI